jgi:hypothetical protein
MTCPVCAYRELPYPPNNYNICPCCGTEFGNDDQLVTHFQLRQQWIANGAHWFFGDPPVNWDPYVQLSRIPVQAIRLADIAFFASEDLGIQTGGGLLNSTELTWGNAFVVERPDHSEAVNSSTELSGFGRVSDTASETRPDPVPVC